MPFDTDPYPRLAEEFIEEYHHRRFECELQPGARELIEFFHSTNGREAEAMGVRSALVANGHNSKERLEACGVPVFDSLAELHSFM